MNNVIINVCDKTIFFVNADIIQRTADQKVISTKDVTSFEVPVSMLLCIQ